MVPLPPLAKVTAATTVFPDTGLPQIPTQSKNSDNELKQTMFHTENAKMLPVFGLNLLCLACGRMLPWWVVFRVVTGTPTDVSALFPRCAETLP